MKDYNLKRFVIMQDFYYKIALSEIVAGFKESHWMWYIFPQLKGLGKSVQSDYYSISGLDEARAYLEHPVLSKNLFEITEALLEHSGKTAYSILGDDSVKLRSSMTLFALVSENNSVFHKVLDVFFEGKMDEQTLEILERIYNN